jgi:hypothetical protein
MSEETTRQFDLSTGTRITADRGDGIHFYTDTGKPNVDVQLSGSSPFTDGSTSFSVDNSGTTKTVSSNAGGNYPMTLTSGGNSGTGNINVDTPMPMEEERKV